MDQLPKPHKATLRMLEDGKTRAAIFQAYRNVGINPEEHFPMTDDKPTYRAKRVSLQVWIDADLRHRLKMLAAKEEVSITDIVRHLIERELERVETPESDPLTMADLTNAMGLMK